VGGTAGVIDVGATRGASGVEDAVWGIAEVVGASRGAAEVGEVGDEGAAQGLATGPPASVRGAV
jgi:hypothetical protein